MKTKRLDHVRLTSGALATVQLDEATTWRPRRRCDAEGQLGDGEGSRAPVEAFMRG